jgi:hypothetical protein
MLDRMETEKLASAMMSEAAAIEERALDASEEEGTRLRAEAERLRNKVSELRGERVPTRDQ